MDIVIAGAGISGLTAAIALRWTGHRVRIYERSSMNDELGAAINVPPNVARFLVPMGLDPARARSVRSRGMRFDSYATMEPGPFDGHSQNDDILKRLATDPEGPGIPVEVYLKSEVGKYNPDGPSITLADGTVISSNLVVAAVGIHSVAVEAILGHSNPPLPTNQNNCCYRFLISKAELDAHEETSFFVKQPDNLICRIYADNRRSRRLVTYACRDYEIMNFVGICRVDNLGVDREDWQCSVDKTEVLKVFEGYHPSLLAVIDKATDVKRWPLLYRPPIPTWHKGRLALAGDAAHPMLPHHGQGGAQGMEDGLAVGLVMHGVRDPSQIEERLILYERIGRNRASSIQVLSNFGFDQTAPSKLGEFLEAEREPVPSKDISLIWFPMLTSGTPESMADMIRLAYGYDVVESTTKTMIEFDPEWKLPDGFFPVQSARSKVTKRAEGQCCLVITGSSLGGL